MLNENNYNSFCNSTTDGAVIVNAARDNVLTWDEFELQPVAIAETRTCITSKQNVI